VAVTEGHWLQQFPEHTLPMIQLHSSRKNFPVTSLPGVLKIFYLVAKHRFNGGDQEIGAFSSLPDDLRPILFLIQEIFRPLANRRWGIEDD